jgi:hypothetical protein
MIKNNLIENQNPPKVTSFRGWYIPKDASPSIGFGTIY